MARKLCDNMVAAAFAGVMLVCTSGVSGANDDAWFSTKPASLAVRPKMGEFFAISGDAADAFNGFLTGEVGLKGTFNHFGLEWSVGAMGSNWYNDRPKYFDPEATSGIMKVTGTYELNPLAGVPNRTDDMSAFDLKDANVYVGGGMGYYPTWVDYGKGADDDDYFDGGGFHAVAGAEYFFQRHLGAFAECQYTFLSYRFDKDMGDTDIHGISLLLGLTCKF